MWFDECKSACFFYCRVRRLHGLLPVEVGGAGVGGGAPERAAALQHCGATGPPAAVFIALAVRFLEVMQTLNPKLKPSSCNIERREHDKAI